MNELKKFAINCNDNKEITRRFIEAEKFPEDILGELAAFLDLIHTPLAVRSSSLLEDSQYHPFAGVYETYMIPNNQHNSLVRLNDLINTIKRVYASTFYQRAKDYIKITSYRLEEEKMAVIIQKMIGITRGNKFYPDFSGVGKSHNFYPLSPQKPSDGIVSVALGLGKTVVEGGNTVRFCPKYPADLIQFYSVEESLNNSQRYFYALQLNEGSQFEDETHDTMIKKYDLNIAEEDGPLKFVGSTYSAENDNITDGLGRKGIRVVTFGPILRGKLFPLPGILELLLDMGTWGMGTPIEIEFAGNLSNEDHQPKQFSLLQIRPLVIARESEEASIGTFNNEETICFSDKVLGNGVLDDIKDIIYVDKNLFDRSKSRDVAREVNLFNNKLLSEKKPYLLIGVGRWGTLDPWLGIPVTWEQISGAKAIVEADFKEISVEPSQGSHFFQNITSFMVGYFTVNLEKGLGYLDWEWLLNQKPSEKMEFTKHLRFKNPIVIKMNGHENKGVIFKPSKGKN
jgi:hypothetical protein